MFLPLPPCNIESRINILVEIEALLPVICLLTSLETLRRIWEAGDSFKYRLGVPVGSRRVRINLSTFLSSFPLPVLGRQFLNNYPPRLNKVQ